MPSTICESAIEAARKHGKAILKFISPNDVGSTGSHQCGYYLPKRHWQYFTLKSPEKGKNKKSDVTVDWHDGIITESSITWYGKGTRSEYRLTRFGRGFRWLNQELIGSLLIIVPKSLDYFYAFVLVTDDDIDCFRDSLGVSLLDNVELYDSNLVKQSQDLCVREEIDSYIYDKDYFPSTRELSEFTSQMLVECVSNFNLLSYDEKIVKLIDEEYNLFKAIEKKIVLKDIQDIKGSIDKFISLANSILNRRKARAGRSLENHFEWLLKTANIPHAVRSSEILGQPDILIPGTKEYNDYSFPDDKIYMVGLKTTCKDRWRQILEEAPRLQKRYLFTLQQGISSNMLENIYNSGVKIVVPKAIQAHYPENKRSSILTVQQFIETVQKSLVG